MLLEKLELRYFRNYKSEDFEFKSPFTVVIGNNGLGKSSILKAAQVACGAFLQSLPILPSTPLYRRNFKLSEQHVWYDNDKKDYISADFIDSTNQTTIVAAGTPNDSGSIEWRRSLSKTGTTSHKKPDKDQIEAYALGLMDSYNKNEVAYFPVLANFESTRVNAQVRKVDKSWAKMNRILKGYYASLSSSVDYSGLYYWLLRYDINLKDGKEHEGTRESIFNALKTAIPYIKEIYFDTSTSEPELELVIDFEDGQSVERKRLSNCSDGVKSMVNMVAEIAYRAVMLNGRTGADCISKTPGLVIIDELDMLLHPNWQQHVVKDLRAAFPSMQFIATTHSPFIVKEMKKEQVINLGNENNIPVIDIAKATIEDVSEEEMKIKNYLRSEEYRTMHELAAAFYDAIASGKVPDAELKSRLDILMAKFSDDPAYSALLEAEYKSSKKSL